MGSGRDGQALLGVAFVVAVLVMARLAIGQFNHEFTRSVPLAVDAPRAGLLLVAGSPVKLRGVVIGRVGSVAPTPSGARIDIDISPEFDQLIPADVRARLVPPTVFGAKYVELRTAETTVVDAIRPHTVIPARHVTVETSTTFAHLAELLRAVPADKANATLTALATALSGHGEQLGDVLADLDDYLARIEPDLQTLAADIVLARHVTRTYAGVAPALVQILDNLTATSNAILDDPDAFHRFLVSLRSVSTKTRTVLEENRRPLVNVLRYLRPVSRLLAKYSPEVSCLIKGLVVALPLAEDSIGGRNPGMTAESSFIPPVTPYLYPQDLVEVKADNPPNCYGLPNPPGGTPTHKVFKTGRDPYVDANPNPGLTPTDIAELFFGSLRGTTP